MANIQVGTSTIPIIDEDLNIYYITLSSNETNAAIIARMRDLSIENSSAQSAEERSSIHALATKAMYALLMRKPAVGKGLVLKARDTEVLTIAPQHAYKIKKDDTLTKLLFGSGPVPECGNLYAYLVGGVENDHAGYTEVWCIYRVVSGSAASAWLLIALGIAVVIGFGVGVGVGDGKLGLDIGTGVFAVFTGIHLAIVLGMVY